MTTELETIPDATIDEQDQAPQLVGLMAEYKDVDSAVQAARVVRDRGFKVWDLHSPFPIHGIDKAMGLRATYLPWIVLIGGLFGMASGIALQVWTMSIDYPFLASGKPLNSFPAWVPIIFELTILCSSLAAVAGMLLLNRLPMLYNPLFNKPRFRRVTDDRFFIVIGADDEKFDEIETMRLLESTGALLVDKVED
ncbi:MAG: DUF3341 domain-containing protein [Phycisphaerales bacterium]|nr:DUF3341 domain-containing protein [Phycisphaerales bacterium]